MNDDDIDFPEATALLSPENLHLEDLHREIKNPDELQSLSKFPLQIETQAQKVTEADLTPLNLTNIDKKALINEMSDCDMYLKNIHTGFKSVTSVNSLIKLVAAGIGVHKHRRQVLNDIKTQAKSKTLEFDENGNLKA